MRIAVGRLARSNVVHVLFAFLAMGGWAVFANRTHSMPAPLIAGLVQGGLSASITLFLKRLIEALAAHFRGPLALVGPPLIAGLVSASLLAAILLAAIHGLSNTPEIAATIALPLTVATGYAALYNYSLLRLGKG